MFKSKIYKTLFYGVRVSPSLPTIFEFDLRAFCPFFVPILSFPVSYILGNVSKKVDSKINVNKRKPERKMRTFSRTGSRH